MDTCDVGPVVQNNHILQPPRSAVVAGSLGWREEIEFAFNRRELRVASGLKRLAGRLSIPLWERSRWTRLAVEEKKEGEMEEKLPPWILNTFKSEKYIFERLLLDFLGSTSKNGTIHNKIHIFHR